MPKVQNAIILAAGRGSRLKHLTDVTPKPLLAPRGVRFIDGIISNLKAKGINDIYVITGYHANEFDYLKDQGIKLIHNSNWDKGNNVTSIDAAKDILGDSLIVNGDIIMEDNVFKTEYVSSLTYVEQDSHIDEWLTIIKDGDVVDFDKNGKDKEGLYQREIIFITKDLAEGIKDALPTFDMEEYQEYLMLQVAKAKGLKFTTYEVPTGTIYDLDTVEEFNEYKNR